MQPAKVTYAKALYDYPGNAEKNVLSFKQGSILEVLIKNEGGWWTGVVDGYAGYFPSNFVVEIDEEEARRLVSGGDEASDSEYSEEYTPRDEEDGGGKVKGGKKHGNKGKYSSSRSQPASPKGETKPSRSGTVIGTGGGTERKAATSAGGKGGSAISSRLQATTPRGDSTDRRHRKDSIGDPSNKDSKKSFFSAFRGFKKKKTKGSTLEVQ